MRRHAATLLLLISAIANGEEKTPIEVSTPRGRLRGWHVDMGSNDTSFWHGSADVFLGIPFVLPPVKERRFKKPAAVCKYTNDDSVFVAQEYRDACFQRGSCADAHQSEDCLYLNVFTPDVNSAYKYPVMLYIHGGALMRGCAQEYPYQGAIANLVSRGVVVVTIQYRIGMLGFFTTATDDFPANLGMHDQVEAIKWVNDQIVHFGGDPYRITLFGQSAGAASVSAHTYSPLSQDLFQQAIMESGVALTTFEGSLGYDHLSFKRALCDISIDDWLGHNFTGLKTCLDTKDPAEWIDLDKINILGWKMQVDDSFMPDIPHHLAPMRRNIPIMMGSNHDEWAYYDMLLLSQGISWPMLYSKYLFEFEFDVFATFFGDRMDDMKTILENVYAGVYADPDDHLLWIKSISGAFTAGGFTQFIHREFSDYLANQNSRVYLYEMTYSPNVGRIYDIDGWPEAVPHTAEVAYLWKREKNWNAAFQNGRATEVDMAVSEWFGKTWTDFAKYGQPKPDGSWKPLPVKGQNIFMNINGPNPVMDKDYMPRDNIVWNQIVPALTGDFFPPQNTNSSAISHDKFNQIKTRGRDSSCVNPPPITTLAATTTTPTTTPPITTSSELPSTSFAETIIPPSTQAENSESTTTSSTTRDTIGVVLTLAILRFLVDN